jgi:hypothetical protein
MKIKHLRFIVETRAFGIQTVYRNAGLWLGPAFSRQVFEAFAASAFAFLF